MNNPNLQNSSEIRSGFFVTLSLVTLLVLLFTAGRFQFLTETTQVPILFNYISGLEKDSPVHFAGHKVGKVTDIHFLGQEDAKVQVMVSISKDAVLKEDTEAFINVLGFMGEMFVELSPGSPEAAPLPENQPIRGTDPIALMEIIKQSTKILDEFDKTTDSLQHLIENLESIVGENQGDLENIVDNLNDTSKNLKDMTEDLKQHPWKLLRKSDGGKSKKRRLLFF